MSVASPRFPRIRVSITLAGLLLALAFALSLTPARAEALCADGGPAPLLSRALSLATSWLPFSLAEALLVGLVLTGLVQAGHAASFIWRRREGGGRRLASLALTTCMVLSVLVATFFPLFGAAYARPPLAERWGLVAHAKDLPREEAIAELEALAGRLVTATNEAYRAATGSDDVGGASAPQSSMDGVDAAIERGYARVAARFPTGERVGLPRGPSKPVLLSSLMSYAGIGGIFIPWTGEANVNRLLPPAIRAHTLAHEKAHQRLFASEDEANFMGFLACAGADDPYARYAGLFFAQRQLLFELLKLDEARAAPLVKARRPGVQKDVDAHRAFLRAYESRVADVTHAVNHAYLSANGVKGGIASYGLSARLIVALARSQGGDPVPRFAPP